MTLKRWISATFALALATVLSLPAAAVPTRVMVRAVSRDAKILHDGVGGARITLRDAESGEVLAEGVQSGGSGSTAAIMTAPRQRGEDVYATEGAAGYLATLDLEEPTLVEVIAEGPLDTPQSTYRASKTLLLLPGRDVLGDGILLEIHGFRIQMVAPAHDELTSDEPAKVGEPIPVRVLLTMT